MKKYTGILILSMLFFSNTQAQANLAEWKEYFEKNTPDNYINFSYSRGKTLLQAISCSRYNKSYYLIERKNGELKKVTATDERIFNILNNNWKDIRYLKKKLNRPGTREARHYADDSDNPSIEFRNVAIKYRNLHYNHFRLKTEEEIKTLKNDKMVRAYKALSELAKALHQEII